MFLAQGGGCLSGSVGATDWEGAATAGISPCLEGAESWLCFPKGFSLVSSSPACPWGTSHPLASEACGERGRPSSSSLLWGSRAQAATPIVVAQKAGLDSGPRPPRAEQSPCSLPKTLCPFAIQEASLWGRPVAGFQKRQPVFRMALSAAEQGWLEGWVC